jgi:hypothetical protein
MKWLGQRFQTILAYATVGASCRNEAAALLREQVLTPATEV